MPKTLPLVIGACAAGVASIAGVLAAVLLKKPAGKPQAKATPVVKRPSAAAPQGAAAKSPRKATSSALPARSRTAASAGTARPKVSSCRIAAVCLCMHAWVRISPMRLAHAKNI